MGLVGVAVDAGGFVRLADVLLSTVGLLIALWLVVRWSTQRE
jgi:hypothetical protein